MMRAVGLCAEAALAGMRANPAASQRNAIDAIGGQLH